MKKLHYITIVLMAMLLSTKNAQAQLPYNDSAWVKIDSLSDDFSGSSVDLTKWDTTWNYWQAGTNVGYGAEWSYGRNDSADAVHGYLYMKGDSLYNHPKTAAYGTFPDIGYGKVDSSLTFVYQGAIIKSKRTSYGFGYVEIYAKFPSKEWPLWVGPWLNKISTYNGVGYYNEIDIAENGGPLTFSANLVGNNWYVQDDTTAPRIGPWGGAWGDYAAPVLASTDSLSGAFHKFAVQWDPHQFIYYFDDKITSIHYDATGELIPQHKMDFFLQFEMDPKWAYLPANWDGPYYINGASSHGNKKPTHWPQYFVIDYMHYYKLNTDCGNTLTICNPNSDYYHPSGLKRAVKKSINTGTGCGSGPTFKTSEQCTLRATDYVILDAGTIIDASSGTGYFAIDIIACPQ